MVNRRPEIGEKIKSVQTKQAEFNFLKSQKLISGLSPEKIQELISKITTQTKQANELIFDEGAIAEAILFVREGQVRLTKPSAGDRLLGVRREAEMFGEMALLNDEARAETATAGQDGCVLLQLMIEDFKNVIGDNDQVEENIVEYAQQQLLKREVMLKAQEDDVEEKLGHSSYQLLNRGNIEEGWLFRASYP